MVHVKLMPLCACVPLIQVHVITLMFKCVCGCVRYVFIVYYMTFVISMLLCQHTVIIIIPHWFVGDVILYIQVETTLLVRENLKQNNFDIIDIVTVSE